MKQIQLTQGYICLVDDEDFEFLSQFKWEIDKRASGVYVKRYVYSMVNGKRKRTVFYIHRYIMGVTDKKVFVDHEDGNTMNNMRSNLRVCTQAQNSRNKKYRPNTSGFKGVHPRPSGRWASKIMYNYQTVTVGTFDTPEEAARAYDEKAKELFGEFARPNFQTEQNS
jgi:hypothetical protein